MYIFTGDPNITLKRIFQVSKREGTLASLCSKIMFQYVPGPDAGRRP